MRTKSIVRLLALLAGAAIALPSAAPAQLGGLLKKKEAVAPAATVDVDAFAKASADAAGQVLTARITFLEAQMKLMEALGLKTDAVAKASAALRAQEGPSSKPGDRVAALKDSQRVTAEANKEMEQAMAKSEELSAEGKAKFAEGTGKFIEGVILEKEQIDTLRGLVDQGKTLVSSAGPLQKVKVAGLVKPVSELATMVPGDVKEGTVTLSKLMSFARSQKVVIPNAEKAAASIGEL